MKKQEIQNKKFDDNQIQTFDYKQIELRDNDEVVLDICGRKYRGAIVNDYPNLKEMEVIIF